MFLFSFPPPQICATMSGNCTTEGPTPVFKELAGKFMLTYQKGKGPKLVSVIIPDDVVPGLRKLVEMREHVGVSEANLNVFAYTEHSLNHVSR